MVWMLRPLPSALLVQRAGQARRTPTGRAARRQSGVVPPCGNWLGYQDAASNAQQPPHVGRLPGVLQAVLSDADQPHAQRDEWIPPAVDDAIQVC
jgi:hypothetical protein